MPQPQQRGIRAASVTYTTAHSKAGSLIHWARPRIKPATSWFLVRFINHCATVGTPSSSWSLISTKPQWKLIFSHPFDSSFQKSLQVGRQYRDLLDVWQQKLRRQQCWGAGIGFLGGYGLDLAESWPRISTLRCQLELLSRRLLGHQAKHTRENPIHNRIESNEILGINVTKLEKYFYIENYKTLVNKTEDKKWEDFPC